MRCRSRCPPFTLRLHVFRSHHEQIRATSPSPLAPGEPCRVLDAPDHALLRSDPGKCRPRRIATHVLLPSIRATLTGAR